MSITPRAAFAACLFAAAVAGAPQMAHAHQDPAAAATPAPATPGNLRVALHGEPTIARDGTETYHAVRVTWSASHHHYPPVLHEREGLFFAGRDTTPGGTTYTTTFKGYWLAGHTIAPTFCRQGYLFPPNPRGCYVRHVTNGTAHTITGLSLSPGDTYRVAVKARAEIHFTLNDENGQPVQFYNMRLTDLDSSPAVAGIECCEPGTE